MNSLATEPPVEARRSLPAKIRAMIVMTEFGQPDALKRAVQQVPTDCFDILIVDGVQDGILSDVDVQMIHREKFHGDEPAILTACPAARRMDVTHIVTLDSCEEVVRDQLRALYKAIRTDADAIILGRRVTASSDKLDTKRRRRSPASFWLRLQTGVKVTDPRCGLRAYPLTVLENLRLHTRRPYLFEMEVLVRAAWAGVTVKEVDLCVPVPSMIDRAASVRNVPAADRAWMSLLNIHLTMRSITPLPHKKIVEDKTRPGEKISVLHPLRSIRTLLTENTSAGQLSLAAALGVFLGTLPLIALHSVSILFAAGYFRLNKIAALAASQLCMPPLVPALCIEAGYFVRHGEFLTEISLRTLGYEALERLYEWLIGAFLLAPILAALVGLVVYTIACFIHGEILRKE